MNQALASSRLLVAEPHVADRQALTEALRPANEIIPAASGEEALRMAAKERPDLILLAMDLPDMDGFETCRRLKADKDLAAIPVILLAEAAAEPAILENLSCGVADYLLKPLRLSLTRLRVGNLLEFKHTYDKLISTSAIDDMTGIPNRRRFIEALEAEWRRCARYHRPLALVLADVDYFTLYNVSQGAAASEDCLWKVAKELNYTLRRSSDLVSRLGGESFAVILPETDAQGAAFVAEMMQRNLAGLNLKNPSSPISDRITLSIGVACIVPQHDESSSLLLKTAEKALAEAKGQGRNRTEFISLIE